MFRHLGARTVLLHSQHSTPVRHTFLRSLSTKKRDFYDVLGCSKASTPAELKKAYFTLAKKYHPDQNKGNKDAEKKFQEAAEAYEVLSDDGKKKTYDQFGHAGVDGANAGGPQRGANFDQRHAEDIFKQFFGGSAGGFGGFQGGGGFGGGFDSGNGGGNNMSQADQRGEDVVIHINVKLKDVLSTIDKTVGYAAHTGCETCDGTGSATKPPESTTCKQCKGSGSILKSVGGFMRVQMVCTACGGKGSTIKSPCKTCAGAGRNYKSNIKTNITLPAGVDNDMVYRVQGKGSAGMNGAPPGDLLVEVEVEPDLKFLRDGTNLRTACDISFVKAVLGGAAEVPSLDGARLELKVPEGTQHGEVVRVRGKGLPRAGARTGSARGDLYVAYNIKIPNKISEHQRKLLIEFDNDGKPTKPSAGGGADGDGKGPAGGGGSSEEKGLFGKLKETMGI